MNGEAVNVILTTENKFLEYPDFTDEAKRNGFEIIFSKNFNAIPADLKNRICAIIVSEEKLGTDEIALFPCLRTIAKGGTGYDNIDVKAALTRNIIVSRVTTLAAETVSEYAIGLLLGLSRNILQSHNHFSFGGKWEQPKGLALADMTVGIVGLGSIGCATAKKLFHLGAKVIGWNRTKRDKVVELEEQYAVQCLPLPDVMKESDAVVISLALKPETRGIISLGMLALMKPESILINVGRGALIDEQALPELLRKGKIGGLALDVFSEEPPFHKPFFQELQELAKNNKNIIMTPHMAVITRTLVEKAAYMVIRNVIKTLQGNLEGLEMVTE